MRSYRLHRDWVLVLLFPDYDLSILLGVGMLNNSFSILIFASDHTDFTLSPHDIVSRRHDFMFGQSRIKEIPLDCIFMVDDCCWSDGSDAVQVSTQVSLLERAGLTKDYPDYLIGP